jgi:chemotaxis protein MotA
MEIDPKSVDKGKPYLGQRGIFCPRLYPKREKTLGSKKTYAESDGTTLACSTEDLCIVERPFLMRTDILASLQPYMRAPVIGAVFGALLVISPIVLGGQFFLLFFSLGGLVIVVGGVITVAFMSFETEEVIKALEAIRRLFKDVKPAPENLKSDVTAIIYCAKIVLEKGMRNLESTVAAAGIRDPFVNYGLNMVVSEYAPEDVRAMMETAADACYERDSVPVEVLQAMTSHAPAFGMVGTLVGMVIMLCSLSENIADVGPSLAIAFLSTLYGVLSARMVYIPAASKLRKEVDQRRFRNHLIIEGMVMLVAKKAPMYVQDRLNSFLRPEAHDYFNVLSAKNGATANAKWASAA